MEALRPAHYEGKTPGYSRLFVKVFLAFSFVNRFYRDGPGDKELANV